MTTSKIKFEDLRRESQQKCDMSRQTFATRLESLREEGTVGRKKPYYFLKTGRSRIDYDQSRNFILIKLDKQVEGLTSQEKIFDKSYSLLVKIFLDHYLPTKLDEVFNKQFYDSYELMQCRNFNKHCEKLIQKIISIMWKKDKFTAQNVINSVELKIKS